jgi:hypothetical protein
MYGMESNELLGMATQRRRRRGATRRLAWAGKGARVINGIEARRKERRGAVCLFVCCERAKTTPDGDHDGGDEMMPAAVAERTNERTNERTDWMWIGMRNPPPPNPFGSSERAVSPLVTVTRSRCRVCSPLGLVHVASVLISRTN